MTYAPQLLALAGIFLLGCISPGPDFIAVTTNALRSRSRGLGVAIGTATACSTWAALAMFGFSFLLGQIVWLYDAVRLIGAAYLIYLGIKILFSVRRRYSALQVGTNRNETRSPVLIGFTVGMTNPKTAAFFGSLFITILPADMPVLIQGAAIGIVAVVALGWFSLLALLFSIRQIRTVYDTMRRPIDALMGTILLGLGLRLAATR